MKKALVLIATVFMMVMTLTANESFIGDEDPLNIYPNPAQDYIQVDFSYTQLEIPEIKIFDLTGKVVKKYEHHMQLEGELFKYTIDLSDLNQGIYFIKLSQGEKVYTKKLLVK